jgi:hypothetical protein
LISRCAEHQKCIRDDVLQLSKLRANVVLSNNFFLPFFPLYFRLVLFTLHLFLCTFYLLLFIFRCAEHQKCITDDVLQLSKLRANKLVLSNNFFLAKDVVNTVVRMFSVQAQNKGLILEQIFPGMNSKKGKEIKTERNKPKKEKRKRKKTVVLTNNFSVPLTLFTLRCACLVGKRKIGAILYNTLKEKK